MEYAKTNYDIKAVEAQHEKERLIDEKNMNNSFEEIIFEGKILKLKQWPYIDTDFTRVGNPPVYRARAEDDEGNSYNVEWDCREDYQDFEEESEHCDWEDYAVTEM